MNSKVELQRHYHLDWLRIMAIIILLVYHVGMLFNTWGWHVKNSETSSSFDYWMIWLHSWRMPLLLFISGAGAYFSMSKRSVGSFAQERTLRLFVPLIFGIFIIVPPQIYFEYKQKYGSYWDFYKTVFDFQPYPPGSFSWHHLWFIAYLFLYSLLCIPFLKFLHSEKSDFCKRKIVSVVSHPVLMLSFPAIIIFFTQLILRPFFEEETHALLNDWAYFTFYFCFFLFGIICYSVDELPEAVKRGRWTFLTAAILILIPYYTSFPGFDKVYPIPWSEKTNEIIFAVSGTFCSWFTVITMIAFAAYYLDRNSDRLASVTEGLYPFYILHQTVIVAVGYYIRDLDGSIGAKFLIVTATTLFICLSMYFLIIKPFKLPRILFGMKASNSKHN